MLSLLQFSTTAGRTQKVLVLSLSNDPVNDLTATLTSAITAAGLTKRVVRLHIWSTEEELVKSRSQQDHPREQINRMIDNLEPAIAVMEAAAYLTEQFRAIITTPLGTKDSRVHLLETSLSHLILRVSGIILGHNTELEQVTYATFRDGYYQFGEGEHEGAKQAATFAQQLKDLREYTLLTCDVVVTTCSNAAEAYVLRSFAPDVTDEAAKTTELDLQLRPTVKTDHAKNDEGRLLNCFAPQLTRSSFNWFCYLGLPVILLREQFLMTAGLSRPASRISYKGRLIDAKRTDLAQQPQSQMFLQWTRANYPETIGTTPSLLLNVRNTVQASVGKSAMNLDTAAVSVNTVISLLEFGFPARDIAIIVFYQAQSETYKIALRHASQALRSQVLQDV
ncbi:MAG: hypothetical protein M1826_003074 [Phylliscum demangeonii]|nr:MAG: hypothetical protein M1826_003074 [Phylliscum demangeonii]